MNSDKLVLHIRLYRGALINSVTPTVVLDEKGYVFDCSSSFADLLGTSRGDLQDKYLFSFLNPVSADRTLKTFTELNTTKSDLLRPFFNWYGDTCVKWLTSPNFIYGGYRIAECVEANEFEIAEAIRGGELEDLR